MYYQVIFANEKTDLLEARRYIKEKLLPLLHSKGFRVAVKERRFGYGEYRWIFIMPFESTAEMDKWRDMLEQDGLQHREAVDLFEVRTGLYSDLQDML
jgi:hypothetical protein